MLFAKLNSAFFCLSIKNEPLAKFSASKNFVIYSIMLPTCITIHTIFFYMSTVKQYFRKVEHINFCK